jgi:hypothetical protein
MSASDPKRTFTRERVAAIHQIGVGQLAEGHTLPVLLFAYEQGCEAVGHLLTLVLAQTQAHALHGRMLLSRSLH